MFFSFARFIALGDIRFMSVCGNMLLFDILVSSCLVSGFSSMVSCHLQILDFGLGVGREEMV